MKTRRREFLKTSALAGAGMALSPGLAVLETLSAQTKAKPIVISSANGLKATAKAMDMILQGTDALDAVVTGVNIVEDDPNDMTVGYGGLPNEDGVVELDACVMHGPSCRGGAVASLRNIKNPSKVAKVIMERSDHVLLVGEGALRFAKAHGFKEEDLLTDQAREVWLKWKENLSKEDDWLPEHKLDDKDIGENLKEYIRTTGTINCNAIDANGNLSGVTTTSGLAFKIAGRVGDSAILGAGLYVDNEIGVAGSTGRGEANLLNCSSVMIVEYMRQGKSPEQSCLMACQRIVDRIKEARLLNEEKKPKFNVTFYALNKKGEYGSAAIWSGPKFALNTGEKESVLKESAFLFKKK
jgi:N4-(beta-N-acetylglucosaminyl)-L-asparaginase